MIPFLAELPTPSPNAFGNFVICFLAAAIGADVLLKLADRLKGKPGHPANDLLEKRIDKLEGDFKKERDDNEVHMSQRSKTIFDQINDVRTSLDEKIDSQMRSSEESRARLHDRMNPISENTAEIKGKLEAFTDSFRAMTDVMKSNNEVLKAVVDHHNKR